MVTIKLRFPTGKWHATPWDRQVNEGAVEWPPSPWRLLRALIAVWHHKCHDVDEADMRQLVDLLTSPPVYRLPPASPGHTRHYMPTTNTTTKIFDTFFAVPPESPLLIGWPDVTLETSQKALLDRLLKSMSYFGRAESWVCAQLGEDQSFTPNAKLHTETGVEDSEELVRLLTPVSQSQYTDWRDRTLTEFRDRKLQEKRNTAIAKGKPPEKVKLTKTDLKKLDVALPKDIFEALHAETGDLRKAGWNRPPGTEWVDYVREKSKPLPPQARRHRSNHDAPTVARYAIAGAVRPKLTDALWMGERARHYLMGCSKRQNGKSCSFVFSGKNGEGQAAHSEAQPHQHAHYLCESSGLNNQGRMTHLTIYAPKGFSRDDLEALGRFKSTHGEGKHKLQYVLLGVGQPADFGGLHPTKGDSLLLAESRVWVSRTPMVLTDHLHIRGEDRATQESLKTAMTRELDRIVRKELSRRPWLAPIANDVSIGTIEHTQLGGTKTVWRKFRRRRQQGGGQCSSTQGYGLRLTFRQPIRGPILLGYGSHLGLGQFVADEA